MTEEQKTELTMQFYFAIIHILDGIALSNLDFTPELETVLNTLSIKSDNIIQDIADANDCDYDDNTTWNDLVNEFKRLWKEGERVESMKLKEFKETDLWQQANIVKYYEDETGEEIEYPTTEVKRRRFWNREVVGHGTEIDSNTRLRTLEVFLK